MNSTCTLRVTLITLYNYNNIGITICFYNSKLLQEGLTNHEISIRVSEKALNESESIYGTLYGTLE